MFGFLTKLTPKDPKENGYQNPHLVFLMQVRALTRSERNGALMVDAHGLEGHTFDAPLSRSFGGTTTMFGDLEQFFGLVTISKTPSLFTCFYIHDIIQHVHVLCVFVLHVVNTWLDVVFVKTCIYTCTSSEQHMIHIRLHFIVHLYSRYAHVQASFDDSLIYTCCCLFSCFYFMYMYFIFKSNKYTCIPVSLLPSCKYL